jgi:hypothetical protein
MEEDRMPKKIFTQELEGTRRRGRPKKEGREEVERDLQVLEVRRWREFVTDRDKMEGHFSTGQSPQRAVMPMEEGEEGGGGEEEEFCMLLFNFCKLCILIMYVPFCVFCSMYCVFV